VKASLKFLTNRSVTFQLIKKIRLQRTIRIFGKF